MAFNSNPGNVTPPSSVESTAFAIGGAGRFPPVPQSGYKNTPPTGALAGTRVPGFVGDGDYINLPVTNGVIEYYNAANVLQWSKTRTNIFSGMDDWCGFIFDGTLIYLVGVDEGTTPNTYVTASIDVAGTIVNIGNAQPASDFTSTATAWGSGSLSISGSSHIQRASFTNGFGSGNILVRQLQTVTGLEEMEIDITDGSIISDPATIAPDILGLPLKTISGMYLDMYILNIIRTANPDGDVFISNVQDPAVQRWLGTFVSAVGSRFFQWEDRFIFATNSTAVALTDTRLQFTAEALDQWVREMYQVSGGKL